MRRFLLYIGSPKQIEQSKQSLERIEAKPYEGHDGVYVVSHKFLADIELVVTLLPDINLVTQYLRYWPLDLLIYDERAGALDAITAIHRIDEYINSLAQQWGPDFHFPKSRMMTLLEASQDIAAKTFALGRINVKDILVAPPTLTKTLRWIARLIVSDWQQRPLKIGAAFSGGAIEGFMHQIGCAHALNRAFKKGSLYDCHAFSGVSSGSMIAATLACGVPLKEVILSIHGRSQRLPPFSTSRLFDFAGKQILYRLINQSLAFEGLSPEKWGQKLLKTFPTGLFKGEGLRQYVKQAIQEFGDRNSFSALDCDLFIGTTHQDAFEHVVMGLNPWQDVSISDAVRASCAIPPFFSPHQVGGQSFIDGQITGGCSLELLVKRGCNLIFIIDPVIPYASAEMGVTEKMGGLYTFIQSIKSLFYTRFRNELAHLTERFPDVDFLVFQPYDECAAVMRGSPIKYWVNTKIVDLSYKTTLMRLRERYHVYHTKLLKYGIELYSPQELLELERKGIDI
ncbi:MAG: patatin-like phospholipase family protein [Oligoflexales bacterium]|nr:patatin-like phospholipase family protein [Oligoflexales bacterium]